MRLAAAWLLLTLCAPGAFAGASKEKTPVPERIVISNVDRYRLNEPLFEAVRVVLAFHGEKYTPAYIQGISGAAFRIGGPCPCAPTCEGAMLWPGELIQLLGYECQGMGFSDKPQEQLPAVLARLREEIRAGRPVMAWNAFTIAEFNVVCGFDETKGTLLGRSPIPGKEYNEASKDRLADTSVAPAIGIITIGKKVKPFDARAAEVAALKEAVAHAHGASRKLECLPAGLASYDYWIAAYENRGKLVRAKSREGKQDLGWVAAEPPDDFYPLLVYPETHRAAADFLREIAPKYPAAKAHLEMAAEHFARDAAALEACRSALGDRKKAPTDEQCVKAAGYLRQARAMYTLGIKEVAAALSKIPDERK